MFLFELVLSAGLSNRLGEGDLERKEREGEAGREPLGGLEGGAETASMSE